jgi:hypothetical protein
VVGVEPAQHVLLGFAATLMLAHDQARHEPQHIGGSAVREQLEVLAGNE